MDLGSGEILALYYHRRFYSIAYICIPSNRIHRILVWVSQIAYFKELRYGGRKRDEEKNDVLLCTPWTKHILNIKEVCIPFLTMLEAGIIFTTWYSRSVLGISCQVSCLRLMATFQKVLLTNGSFFHHGCHDGP